ncbi:MAG: Holliday junction branch migration protein RuvA [Candidatus Levybacteria bacterium]|nr:Holliday junction branch migration protein RuvA [Candidatus Levybacteria bacterium]
MIGMLRGIVGLRDINFIIVDVQGVGYKVLLSQKALSQIQSTGESIQLFTYTYVRDDAIDLYGFTNMEDLKLFEMLISVSGVGCKSALGIFSIGSRGKIIDAILKNDVAFFMSAPRLGKKNAQKIIIELKSKLGDATDFDLGTEEGKDADEVIQALKGFGFTYREAQDALRQSNGKGETTAERIRQALKYLGK